MMRVGGCMCMYSRHQGVMRAGGCVCIAGTKG